MKGADLFIFRVFDAAQLPAVCVVYRHFVRPGMRNPSIIHRRIGSIHRSGCRNRSGEASRNHQIASPMDQPSGPGNHQLIVNQFPVIINSATLESINNPSPKRRTLSPRRQGLSKRSGLLFLPGNRTNEPLPSMLWAPSGSRKKRRV
jgi:hypothetical protein